MNEIEKYNAMLRALRDSLSGLAQEQKHLANSLQSIKEQLDEIVGEEDQGKIDELIENDINQELENQNAN